MLSILPCSLPFGNAGGLQILCCQGFEVKYYDFTLDVLNLNPSDVCNVGVNSLIDVIYLTKSGKSKVIQGIARVKLHYAAWAAAAAKIICQGTRFARTLTYPMMRISQTIGDRHSAL